MGTICLRAVQTTYLAVQQILYITVDQEVHIKCPHAIQTLLSTAQTHPVIVARFMYQARYDLQMYS